MLLYTVLISDGVLATEFCSFALAWQKLDFVQKLRDPIELYQSCYVELLGKSLLR